jgi:hypothetical protein
MKRVIETGLILLISNELQILFPSVLHHSRQKFAGQTCSGLKVNLAVCSTEFCQCSIDEVDIRKGLGGGSGHEVMIPLSSSICRVPMM